MRAAQQGFIIANASDLVRQPEAPRPDYEVSKVGLLSLTKSRALSEGPAHPGQPIPSRPDRSGHVCGPAPEDSPTRPATSTSDRPKSRQHESKQTPTTTTARWERLDEVVLLRRRVVLHRRCVGVDGGSIRGLL